MDTLEGELHLYTTPKKELLLSCPQDQGYHTSQLNIYLDPESQLLHRYWYSDPSMSAPCMPALQILALGCFKLQSYFCCLLAQPRAWALVILHTPTLDSTSNATLWALTSPTCGPLSQQLSHSLDSEATVPLCMPKLQSLTPWLHCLHPHLRHQRCHHYRLLHGISVYFRHWIHHHSKRTYAPDLQICCSSTHTHVLAPSSPNTP